MTGNRQVIFEPDMPGLLYGQMAQAVMAKIEERATRSYGDIVLGLCGAQSMRGFYGKLAQLLKVSDLLSRLQLFPIEEMIGDKTTGEDLALSDYNEFLLRELFIEPLLESGLQPLQFHSFKEFCATPQMKKTQIGYKVYSYMNELRKHGGKFHVAILNVRKEGGCAAISPGVKPVLVQGFATFINSEYPYTRMSPSHILLRKTECGVLIFGQDKKEALELYISRGSERSCPCKIVNAMRSSIIGTNINSPAARKFAG